MELGRSNNPKDPDNIYFSFFSKKNKNVSEICKKLAKNKHDQFEVEHAIKNRVIQAEVTFPRSYKIMDDQVIS